MLLDDYDDSAAINIGSGEEITVAKLAVLVSKIIGFNGNIALNSDRPNGVPRKLLDCERISRLGWEPRISLEKGISLTYDWFLKNHQKEVYL
jgi:GDP-L-fucose synthase